MINYGTKSAIAVSVIIGYVVAYTLGPLYDVIGHWDMVISGKLKSYLIAHHWIVLGCGAAFSGLVAAEVFRENVNTVFVSAAMVGISHYYFELWTMQSYVVSAYLPLPEFSVAYLLGVFSVIGLWQLARDLLQRKIQRSKSNQ